MNAWHSILRPVIGFILLFGVILVGIESPASGQGTGQGNFTPNTGVTIQLPSISTFGVQTVVSVPDGGTMLLGGNSGFAAGRSSRGVPGLSSIPFLNRPFRNQGIGYNTSSSNASVTTRIIILEEMETAVMKEAQDRAAFRRRSDPNGTADVQKKADFLSRNIGRSTRKRR